MKYQCSSTHCSKVISNIQDLQKVGQILSLRSQGQKIMVPMERSYHKEYSCEILKL